MDSIASEPGFHHHNMIIIVIAILLVLLCAPAVGQQHLSLHASEELLYPLNTGYVLVI